jgi:NAD(P)-dependent dehydrogenase (short-subunit alcohol dehydrogenase family)
MPIPDSALNLTSVSDRAVVGMEIENASVLVTGANRGLGREFVRQALERGSARVWATARHPEGVEVTDPRVRALRLDVTDPDGVTAAARAGGGAVLNVMSVLSFRVFPGNGAYAAAKAAEWMLTNSTRLELAGQGTQVTGLHVSSVDTDMMAGWDVPKLDPRRSSEPRSTAWRPAWTRYSWTRRPAR